VCHNTWTVASGSATLDQTVRQTTCARSTWSQVRPCFLPEGPAPVAVGRHQQRVPRPAEAPPSRARQPQRNPSSTPLARMRAQSRVSRMAENRTSGWNEGSLAPTPGPTRSIGDRGRDALGVVDGGAGDPGRWWARARGVVTGEVRWSGGGAAARGRGAARRRRFGTSFPNPNLTLRPKTKWRCLHADTASTQRGRWVGLDGSEQRCDCNETECSGDCRAMPGSEKPK
jgi:hypothetical protein